MIGRKLGPYKIIDALGSGAMGEVYVARDTRLDRQVALKILRPQLADDFERRERFELEAKAIAALDHPNIVTIHSVEECDGLHFITMQLVDGKPLAQLIRDGGLPIERVLDIGLRLVEAISAAHERGIIHRDLKPGNVMVSADGRVKVLDFGLAKLRGSASGVLASDDPETLALTTEGQIIGTVAYMSPEQAEGRPADQRSDIFSLGILLYEMATGERPFRGETAISIISSIMKDTPSTVSAVRPSLPVQLDRIIRTCLAKDPMRRYQTAIDLRNALDDLKAELRADEPDPERRPAAPPLEATPPVRRTRSPLLLAAIVLVAVAAGFTVGRFLPAGTSTADGSDAAPAPIDIHRESHPLTNRGGLTTSPSWGPDGEGLVYASDESGTMKIWKRLADGRSIPLTEGPANDSDPDWSPDGRLIAYAVDFGNGGLKIVLSDGGTPTAITTFGSRPQWSPDSGRIVFDWRGAIYVTTPVPGSEPRRIVGGTSGVPHVAWSHDGERLYFWNRTRGDMQMAAVDGGEALSLDLVPTGEDVGGLAVAPDGTYLIVSRGPFGGNKDLWLVPLAPDSGLPAGKPLRLTPPFTDDVDPDLSPDGSRLAFAVRRVSRQLWSLPIDPETGAAAGAPTRITGGSELNYYPALSNDGETLAWTAHRSEQGRIHYRHVEHAIEEPRATPERGDGTREIGAAFTPDGRGLVYSSTVSGSYALWHLTCLGSCVPTPLTQTAGKIRDTMPAWSPNRDRIVFNSNRGGSWDLWMVSVPSAGDPVRLTSLPGNEMYATWHPDGHSIAFRSDQSNESGDLWVMEGDGSDPRPLVADPSEEAWGAWHPSGSWYYFTSDRDGVFNIWVFAEGADEPQRVTGYLELARGLPERGLFTKFAVGERFIVMPIEERTADLWTLEGSLDR